MDVVDAMGLPGVFILMLLESACIPVPSEATMLFAGFNVSNGEYSLFMATAVGSVANLVGSWIAYWVGYAGRVDLLEKHGKKLHIKKSHLEWADRWFERHGDATVFFTRMLPIIRTFISLPAGVARMPFWRFSVLTLAGCVPWVLMLTFIGQKAGDNWESWKDYLHYVDYVVAAAIVIGVIYLIVRRRRGGGSSPGARARGRLTPGAGGGSGLRWPFRPMSIAVPASSSSATPGTQQALAPLIAHARRLMAIDGIAFLGVDDERTRVEPLAGWFRSPELGSALEPAHRRPYDRQRPGPPEIVIERDRPLFLPRIEDWEAAPMLLERAREGIGAEAADRIWELYRAGVAGLRADHRTPGQAHGRALGRERGPQEPPEPEGPGLLRRPGRPGRHAARALGGGRGRDPPRARGADAQARRRGRVGLAGPGRDRGSRGRARQAPERSEPRAGGVPQRRRRGTPGVAPRCRRCGFRSSSGRGGSEASR